MTSPVSRGSAVVAVVTLALLTACANKNPPRIAPVEEVLGNGWQCYAAPDEFKHAGVVVEVTRDGRYFVDSDHRDMALSGSSAIGNLEQTVTSSLGGVLSLLRSAGIVTNATTTADLQRSVSVRAKYTGTTKYVISGQGVAEILKSYEGRSLPPASRYILFRESHSAQSIDILIERSAVAELGIETTLDSLVDANTKLSRNGKTQYRLQDSFAEPLGVCALPYELTVIRSADGTTRLTMGAQVRLPPDVVISQR